MRDTVGWVEGDTGYWEFTTTENGNGFYTLLILILMGGGAIGVIVIIVKAAGGKKKRKNIPSTTLPPITRTYSTQPPSQNFQSTGSPLGSFCPKCGTKFKSGDTFCTKCGNKLD